MGNEMGNNNTSGLREEDNITQGKSRQEIPADDCKGQNHVIPAAEDKDSRGKETVFASAEVGREDHNVEDKKKHINEVEDDIMETERKKSLKEAARTDDVKEQNHEVPSHDDVHRNEKGTGLASVNPKGVAEPHDDNQKQDDKEEDGYTIPEAKEKSLQEATHTNKAKEDHLAPAAKDETELISTEPDQIEIASPHIDNRAQDEKATENNSTTIKFKEKSLQEADSQDEVIAQAKADLVPVSADENTHGTETGLVSNETDETAYDALHNQKEDEKEDIKVHDEAKEESSKDAARIDDVERQDHLVPAIDDKGTHGNETGLVSSNPEGIADPHVADPKRDKKEEDKPNAETWDQSETNDAHANDIENKSQIIVGAEGEDCNKMEAEAEFASGNSVVVGDTIDIQTLQGRQVQGASELHPQTESTNFEAEPSDEVSEVREMQPASSTKNLEDHEMNQEVLGKEENVPETSHHFENQNSIMKEDDGARNSIPDAEFSASHYLIPLEPAVLEPEQLAKMDSEQMVQVCNGPQTSKHMIIPSLTSPDRENGLISGSLISTDMVESAFVDPCSEVEKEKVCVLVAEVAKEVSKEEKFELNYGVEDGNNLKQTGKTMTDLPNGVGAKCNGELPGKMNSSKIDPAESQVEAILSDETQNFPLEVSKTEDEGIGLSQKAILVEEESESEDSKRSICQIHSVEESIEQSNGKRSADLSKADEPNACPHQFMMNDQESNETRAPVDTSSCDSKSIKNYQIEEAQIVENGHHVDTSFNYQNEATEEQQRYSKKEVHLVIDPAVISEENFLTGQKDREEESEEREITKEIVEKIEDLNPTFRSESGEQSISHSYLTEQAEASLSPCLALQALPESQQQENDIQGMMVQHSNETKVEMKQECCGEFSPPTSGSSFDNKNLTKENVLSMVELAGEKPLLDLSERPKTTSMPMAETKLPEHQSREQCAVDEAPAIANVDHYQQEIVGRVSTESNPDNMSSHVKMRKSPSFDLDLRIDARAEESDQTPLLYQDKTTIDSFSSQADVTLGKVTVVNTEYNKNSLLYEALPVEEKVVTPERSDSEKSKTPFLGFLKDDEEEVAQMLVTQKKKDNHSATKMETKVSAKEVTSASAKGKEKRKPRNSLFGTCMCCATVIN